MKKIISISVLLLVIIMSGCVRFDGATTVKLYVDDEVYDSFEATIGKTISLEIPEKEGMMFTGWEVEDLVVYDEVDVGMVMNLYATWEDPTVVFGFNEDPMIDYDGQYITSYTGNAIHMKVPEMIQNEYIRGIGHEVFWESDILTLFLPMEFEIFGFPFKDSEIRRIEFYGEYHTPRKIIITGNEFNDIISEHSDSCVVEEIHSDKNWTYLEGCPILEVISKSEAIIVDGMEFFSYEVIVDKNGVLGADISQISTQALYGASKLEIFEIPYAMPHFYQSMFETNYELHTLIIDERNDEFTIVEGVVYINDGTSLYFYPAGMENTTFEVSESVEFIHDHAFLTTTYLETLEIPATYDDVLLLYGAHSLKEIVVDKDNEVYTTIDGVLFKDDILLKYPASKEGASYEIPEGIVSINSLSFWHNKYLEELIISSTVEALGRSVFDGAESLIVLDIPSNVEYLETGLLHRSSITTLIIRRDLAIDGTITNMSYDLYAQGTEGITIYVPDDSYDEYINHQRWSTHFEDIRPISEYE